MPLTWNSLREELPDWKNYRNSCPAGDFSFRIVQTAWGRSRGIHVFAERDDGGKYRFYVPLFREVRSRWHMHHLFKNMIPPLSATMKITISRLGISKILEVVDK